MMTIARIPLDQIQQQSDLSARTTLFKESLRDADDVEITTDAYRENAADSEPAIY